MEFLVKSSEDSSTLARSLNRTIRTWRESGYLQANLDLLEYTGSDSPEITIFVGPKYEWAHLRILGVPASLQDKLARYPQKITDEPVEVVEVMKSLNEVITFSENHGYPFAEIRIDSLVVSGGYVSASLVYKAGPYITFDSIYVMGNAQIKSSFLGAYLGILPGRPFRQKALDDLESKLDRLSFVEITETPKISFQNEECLVTLPLRPVRSNRFDAVLGFLPNEKEGNQLLITGAVDLELTNLFKSGKILIFHWDKPQVESQTLDLHYGHPNVFLSPIGLEFGFHLYKQDTSFINRRLNLGFDYLGTRNTRLSFFSQWESSRLLNTQQYQGDSVLPDVSDYNINYLGARFSNLQNPARRMGPTPYWGLDAISAFGRKNILQNPDLDQSLYSNIQLRSNQFIGQLSIEGLTNIAGSYFLLARVKGGTLVNSQLFLNELFRLGGLNSLRGFNENFFYAQDYLVGTIEFQLFFNGRSNLLLFYDQGYIYYDVETLDYEDSPFGVGAGLRLASENGIFTLVYALGKSQDQPLDFRFSKIHFGYIARF